MQHSYKVSLFQREGEDYKPATGIVNSRFSVTFVGRKIRGVPIIPRALQVLHPFLTPASTFSRFYFFAKGNVCLRLRFESISTFFFSEKSEGYLRQGPMEREYLHLYPAITANFISVLI